MGLSSWRRRVKDNITHNYNFKTFLDLHYSHETKDTEEMFYEKQSSGCVTLIALIALQLQSYRPCLFQWHHWDFRKVALKAVSCSVCNQLPSIIFTGWHIRLSQTSRWHQNKSSVLAWPGLTWTGQNWSFVLKSTGGLAQPDVPPCRWEGNWGVWKCLPSVLLSL